MSNKKSAKQNQWTALSRVPRSIPSVKRPVTVVYSNNSLSSGAAAAGVIAASGYTGTNDWSSFSSLYSEFRILGMRILVFPDVRSAGSPGALILGTDRSAAASTPATATAVASLQNPAFVQSNNTTKEPYVYDVPSSDLQNQLFGPTATSQNPYRVFIWGQANSVASTTNTTAMITNAVFVVQWMLEMKGAI